MTAWVKAMVRGKVPAVALLVAMALLLASMVFLALGEELEPTFDGFKDSEVTRALGGAAKSFHVRIMADGGFITARCNQGTNVPIWMPERLTYRGVERFEEIAAERGGEGLDEV